MLDAEHACARYSGLRTSIGLTYTKWEFGPDFSDFSVSWSFSKNFLNSLIAVRVQASSRKVLSGIAAAFVPSTSWGYTGSCLQWFSDGSGPMVVSRCQRTTQHLMRAGRASLNTSITLGQWCLHRHCATTMSSSVSKLQVMNSCLYFSSWCFKRREEKELVSSPCSYAVRLACDTATDCLIVHLVQSVLPWSPILKSFYCYLYLKEMSSSALDSSGSLA